MDRTCIARVVTIASAVLGLAFAACSEGSSPEPPNVRIFTMDTSRAQVRALTSSSGQNVLAAWSPDGTKIAFDRGLARQADPRPAEAIPDPAGG